MDQHYTASLDFPSALGALRRCLDCGGAVVALAGDDETEFSCDMCGAVWRYTLGRIARVTDQTHRVRVDAERRGPSVGGA